MFKVIAIAMLVITVIGAAGVAVYDSSKPDQAQAQNSLAVTPTAVTTSVPVAGNTNQNRQGSDLGTLPQQQTSGVGQPWAASGAIASIDDFGFELSVDGSGEIIYVELGPDDLLAGAGDHFKCSGTCHSGRFYPGWAVPCRGCYQAGWQPDRRP